MRDRTPAVVVVLFIVAIVAFNAVNAGAQDECIISQVVQLGTHRIKLTASLITLGERRLELLSTAAAASTGSGAMHNAQLDEKVDKVLAHHIAWRLGSAIKHKH